LGVGVADRDQPGAAADRGLGRGQRLGAAAGGGDREDHVGGADPAGDAGAAVADDRHRAAVAGHGGQDAAGQAGRADAGHHDGARAALVGEHAQVGLGGERRRLPHLGAGRRGGPQHAARVVAEHRLLVVEQ
jgi:hypothetical protein